MEFVVVAVICCLFLNQCSFWNLLLFEICLWKKLFIETWCFFNLLFFLLFFCLLLSIVFNICCFLTFVVFWNLLFFGICCFFDSVVFWNLLFFGICCFLESVVFWILLSFGVCCFLESVVFCNLLFIWRAGAKARYIMLKKFKKIEFWQNFSWLVVVSGG